MKKTIAIMQPYIFPYLAYFQLFKAADVFVYFDDIQYIKGGLINRNRILFRGASQYITFPVKKASLRCKINERVVAENIEKGKTTVLGLLREAYSKAPFFDSVYPILEDVINIDENNVARFAEYSQKVIIDYLEVDVEFERSSCLNLDKSLRGEDRVLEIIKSFGGTQYINPIGGRKLYSQEKFDKNGIELKFLKCTAQPYKQFSNEFVPSLSIIDVLMFNSKAEVRRRLKQFELV